jgi:Rps23 Pro-64 3,4-dihydroxylase Tpa1-like proline 4-hydroxylase
MTAKQVLDAFSETLMQDERILSPQERELLTSLLQNSKVVSSSNPEIQSAVSAAISRSVGETVAQRAFALLGGSIVEQILAHSGIPGTEEAMPANMFELRAPQPPQPPSHAPQPPQPPSHAPQPPGKAPQPPQPPSHAPQPPQPPSHAPQPPSKAPQPPQPPSGPHGMRPLSVPVQQGAQQSQTESSSIGILEPPAIVRAQCVVLDEFLAPQELDELTSFALQHEAEFQNSEVISPSGDPGVIDYDHRRSRVLMDLGRQQETILERIRGVLPRVLDQLGIEEFPVTHVEAQITASNDGDFFGAHCDDAQEMIASRRVTFVYFFHCEPCRFEGGELRLHDSRRQGEQQIKTGSYQSIAPRQNQIVFFPCSLLHEITPVDCPSRAFADSRFTLNGWLHK